jgi:hypothetical protein
LINEKVEVNMMSILKKYYFQAICYLIILFILLMFWSIAKSSIHTAIQSTWNLYSQDLNSSLLSVAKTPNPFVDQEDDYSNSSLGMIEVITPGANIRTLPEVKEDNIYFAASDGDQFYYYEERQVDGVIWYKLINSETQEELWISSKTVEIIE